MSQDPVRSTYYALEDDHLKSGLSRKKNLSIHWEAFHGWRKSTFNQAASDIGKRTIDNFTKVLAELNKYAFSANTFHKQKCYLCR